MKLFDFDLFLYNGFDLTGKIQSIVSLTWVRRFDSAGEFELTLPVTKRNVVLLKSSNIIYKGTDGEAALIENIVSDEDETGAAVIVVSGRFLNALLDWRLVTYQKTNPLETILTEIIQENFTAPVNLNRKMEQLRVLPFELDNNPDIALDLKNESALASIQKLCNDNGIGFKIVFNVPNKSYDLVFYAGKITIAEFSHNIQNITEQDYNYLTSEYKNTCYIEYGDALEVHGDENIGLDRREIFASGNTNSLESAQEQARLFLLDYGILETFDTVINSNSPKFQYHEDWDLGDVVASKNEFWDIEIKQNIREITEYYDFSGTNLAPVFGDILPTVYDRMG